MSGNREQWLPIPGAEGFYSVSDFGRVRSEPRPEKKSGRPYGRVLSPVEDTKGYLWFRICLPGKKPRSVKVHRAVAAAFIGPCPKGLQVNHKDGDKRNNRPGNLEYVTSKRNVQHGWETGLVKPKLGERHGMAKLTDARVKKIRAAYPAQSVSALAAKHKVTFQCVWMIVKRKTWKHLD